MLWRWYLSWLVVAAARTSTRAPLASSSTPRDPRFAWIAAIESGPQNTVWTLGPRTYYIDRQYQLPNGTHIVGTGSRTQIVAVATKPAQRGGHFHGCGENHVNRIGFVLGSRCRIAKLHYIGIERSRYPDSHPMCGGSPFQTPGCTTPFCTNSENASWLTFGGRPVRDSIVEDITIAGGTVQNGFWMPENPAGTGHCENITARNIIVTGSCSRPGPCSPTAANGTGGGGTWADGVNIHGAHRHVVVEGSTISHTGDDSFAIWSQGTAATDIAFRNNYAASPRYPRTWLASCFAMYGGNQSAFVNNTCYQSGQRGALYLVDGFRGNFIANVSFVRVDGNNFTNCCPISPGHSKCGVHGSVIAPGCQKNDTRDSYKGQQVQPTGVEALFPT
jgi:hypothetical protein